MSAVFRAPASSANLGPGFDCAAAALDLWNELRIEARDGDAPVRIEGEGASELPHDATNLTLRAFALLAPVGGHSVHSTNRIPLERGLGSSAAAVAIGLAAGVAVAGKQLGNEELLRLGLALEGHADNLAAALAGGVCLTWENRIARVADRLPAIPIGLVPETTVSTAEARSALPESVSHSDAAFTAGRAALLGASLAAGSEELFAQALHDRLHEPYRGKNAPILDAVRGDLPTGGLGATLSGSGPTVIVWVREELVATAEEELAGRVPEASVIRFAVTPEGAGPA